jgi:hypothetical protein
MPLLETFVFTKDEIARRPRVLRRETASGMDRDRTGVRKFVRGTSEPAVILKFENVRR